jgi:hypothetical protein
MSNGWRTHYEAAMLNAFRADQQVRQALNQFGLSFDDDHLEAGVVIKMSMDCGDDCFMVLMLNVRQFFWQQAAVVVVNERDGANDFAVGGKNRRGHEMITDKVAKRFRPVRITAALNELIELLQQSGINGNSGAAEVCHVCLSLWKG